jgi:two-component system OmpR family sensor kinase/two-component system phosphate regulon sensor histidine kinase PhoR
MKFIASYTKKWLVYIITSFLFFAAILLISEFRHEKKFRIEALNEKLDNYARLTNAFIEKNQMVKRNDFTLLDSLSDLISNEFIRITIINKDGTVLFDSQVRDVSGMENHLLRPEIQKAIAENYGSDTRVSGTTKVKYYYYARNYDQCFVRVSDIYNMSARKFIQPDRIYLMFFILLLLAASLTVIILTDKFGKSISTLREFTLKALTNKPINEEFVFPENELGDIGQEIIEIYQNLNRTKEELISEKAKLIRHLNMLDEGIAIFSRNKEVITSNNNFIRFINYLSDTRVFTADEFFRINDFLPIFEFIEHYLKENQHEIADDQPTYEISLNKGGRYFSVKCIVFQDNSFEVSVNDISKPTKRKLLKQQLTDNIAHELKTPVSSIKGFLETILEGNPDQARTLDYLKRAYSQSCRLADLVHDISVITKIEEAGSLYKIETVNLSEVLNDITGEIQPLLKARNITLDLKISEDLTVNGNSSLIYSIFRNLFDNTIDHAGEGLIARLDNYRNDIEYCYFSYSDTGIGVPEEDMPRLFERFYRVDKGRDRKKGGTGLGLAIVKNAIQFHHGDISVKKKAGGGIEFLFNLSKDISKGSKE